MGPAGTPAWRRVKRSCTMHHAREWRTSESAGSQLTRCSRPNFIRYERCSAGLPDVAKFYRERMRSLFPASLREISDYTTGYVPSRSRQLKQTLKQVQKQGALFRRCGHVIQGAAFRKQPYNHKRRFRKPIAQRRRRARFCVRDMVASLQV